LDYLSKRKVFIPRIVYLDISSIVQALLHRNVEQQVASIPVVLFTPSEAVAVDTPLARIPVGVQMVNGQAPLNSRGDRTVLHAREAHICVAQRVSHRAITVARAQPSSIISLAVRHMTAHHSKNNAMSISSCLSSVESFALYFETSGRQQCNFSVFRNRLDLELQRETNCPHDATAEMLALLDLDAESDAVAYINSKCRLVYDNQPQMDWEAVAKKQAYGQPLFDQTYYDGGSYLNEYYQTNVDNRAPYVADKAANVLKRDGSRIDDVYEAYAKEGKIGYADEVVDNFQNCPLRAAMCCFASDRQAGDNNGNW